MKSSEKYTESKLNWIENKTISAAYAREVNWANLIKIGQEAGGSEGVSSSRFWPTNAWLE